MDYDGDGIIEHHTCSTDRGERLKFTEKEWNALSNSTREKIESMLK